MYHEMQNKNQIMLPFEFLCFPVLTYPVSNASGIYALNAYEKVVLRRLTPIR